MIWKNKVQSGLQVVHDITHLFVRNYMENCLRNCLEIQLPQIDNVSDNGYNYKQGVGKTKVVRNPSL